MSNSLDGRPRSIREDLQQARPFRAPSHEAYLALIRTADDAKRQVTSMLEAAGVTLQQYNVLRILRGAGIEGLPTLAIGARMVERTPGVTRLVDRMERKGWVFRERCTEDRRRVWCKITPRGLELLAPLDAPVSAVDDDLFAALEPDEVLRFISYLDRLRAAMTDDA